MKANQIYQALKELAEKLEITVSEQNFRATGVKARSGLCVIKGQKLFLMDKHKSTRRKIEMLAECLAELPHENIFVVPAVREVLEKHSRF
jgi:ubiquinone biosynthesis protein UbiJ